MRAPLKSGAILLACSMTTALAEEGAPKNVNKKVTVIAAQTSADGSSEVTREVTRDCILSLPNPDILEPMVTSEAIYLRSINGDSGRNEWAKSYTAKLDVNYLTDEKELLIITTRAVESRAPVIKEVEKKLRHARSFVSDPSEGGTAAGRSHRQYYFTSREEAVKDVRARARIWIQQQKAVLCEEKK